MRRQVCLALTQRQHLRTWLYQGLLDVLADNFELTLLMPRSLEDVDINHLRIEVVYWEEEKSELWDRITLYLNLIRHRKYMTFAERIKKLIFDEKKFNSRILIILALIKSLRRKPMLYLLHVRFVYLFVKTLHNKHISRKLIKVLPKADIHLVVVSLNDYLTTVLLASLEFEKKHVVQIVENWDNLSSKLCPVYSPQKIIVWGEQTKKHAVEIHGVKPNRVVVLGSPRFPSTAAIDNLSHRSNNPQEAGRDRIRIFYAGFFSECSSLNSALELFEKIETDLPQYAFEFVFRPHPMRRTELGKGEQSKAKVCRLVIDNPIIDESNKSGWPTYSESLYEGFLMSDLVIGSPSTFLLEELLFDCRIILDNRDCGIHYNSARMYFSKSTHFEEILSDPSILRINDVSEAADIVLSALSQEKESINELKNLLIYNDEKEYAYRFLEFLSSELAELE